uniref:Dual specificity protein phosphatase 15 n=1 Tax=Strigops habroptila TaxID=2489341 RepID=A0A672UM77_STRHB
DFQGVSEYLPMSAPLCAGGFYPLDAKDLEQLTRNKITHIVSIHESPQPLLQDITYLRIPLPDTPEANIKRHFKECISFIHQCRLHGGNCLVHCLAGISRSTTVVVAYVMAVTELSCQEVLEAIRTIRPVANPNPGFRQQLAEFEAQMPQQGSIWGQALLQEGTHVEPGSLQPLHSPGLGAPGPRACWKHWEPGTS